MDDKNTRGRVYTRILGSTDLQSSERQLIGTNKQTNKQKRQNRQTTRSGRYRLSVGLSHKKFWASSPHSALPEPVCSPGSTGVSLARGRLRPSCPPSYTAVSDSRCSVNGLDTGLTGRGGGQPPPPGSTRP